MASVLSGILNPNNIIGQSTVDNPYIPNNSAVYSPSWLDNAFGYTAADGTKVNGWGNTAVSLGSSLFSALNGWNQTKLAEDALAWNKKIGMANLTNSVNSYNGHANDQQYAMALAQGKTDAQAKAAAQNYLNTYGAKV